MALAAIGQPFSGAAQTITPAVASMNEKPMNYVAALQPHIPKHVSLPLKPITYLHGEPQVVWEEEEVTQMITNEELEFAVLGKFSYGRLKIRDLRKLIPTQCELKGDVNIGLLCNRGGDNNCNSMNIIAIITTKFFWEGDNILNCNSDREAFTGDDDKVDIAQKETEEEKGERRLNDKMKSSEYQQQRQKYGAGRGRFPQWGGHTQRWDPKEKQKDTRVTIENKFDALNVEEDMEEKRRELDVNKGLDIKQIGVGLQDNLETRNLDINTGEDMSNEKEDEEIQENIKEISKRGDLSPRHTNELKHEKRRGRSTTLQSNQMQTRSSSAKPTLS
ncbi:hypothetical protein H5410_030072 [Solanum commersonii]|uniref:Uncharacterized protein n=1 Tax=Solanum commersonii TaxID=4109 RepID=A0A9J5YI77_SOLCO|nr:hypothetical protein H5410_030072 [Solanum commersonii]